MTIEELTRENNAYEEIIKDLLITVEKYRHLKAMNNEEIAWLLSDMERELTPVQKWNK